MISFLGWRVSVWEGTSNFNDSILMGLTKSMQVRMGGGGGGSGVHGQNI